MSQMISIQNIYHPNGLVELQMVGVILLVVMKGGRFA